MLKTVAVTAKELLLLLRDRTGLLVLFLMPAVLVLVITLVQKNIMELTGQEKTRVVLLDLDQGELGSSLRRHLEAGNLEIVGWDGERKEIADLEAVVMEGDYQAGIVVAADSSARLQEEAAALFPQSGRETAAEAAGGISVQLFFDPAIMAGLRSGITAQLRMALTIIAMEAKLEALDRLLQEGMAGFPVPAEMVPQPGSGLSGLLSRPLLFLEEAEGAQRAAGTAPYSPVQQNVPAWALFGMFFTAIPIAGAILRERTSGIWVRLMALPVSPLVFFGGKALAYIIVCLCQFLIIVLIGTCLFPWFGLPAFAVSMNWAAVLLTVLFSGLAACGYGIFLGMACNSYEQASTVGATTVVTAAAIGGVMVPVYAMPQMMQRLSIISPLNWGLNAFHDLILRGYSLTAILDDLGRLLLFFGATALLSWKLNRSRRSLS